MSKRGQKDVILDQSGVQNGIKIGLGGAPAEGSRTKSKKDAQVRESVILNVDIWEHAYYLDYKNQRPQFLNKIWSIINWEEAERRYLAARADA